MKKLLLLSLVLVAAISAQAQAIRPGPAIISSTGGSGTVNSNDVWNIVQSIGGGGGIAVSNLTGQTYAFATAYTNTTPHYVHLQLNGTVVNAGGAEGSIRTYVDYNGNGVVEDANTYAISAAASITDKVVINEIIPPYGKYTFTNASGGASIASLTATTGKLFFYATNSSGSGDVTQAGLAAGSYYFGFTNVSSTFNSAGKLVGMITNAPASTNLIDLSMPYSAVVITNANTLIGLANFSTFGTNVQWATRFYTNGAGPASPSSITFPASWIGNTAIHYVTNQSVVSVVLYPGMGTNVIVRNLK